MTERTCSDCAKRLANGTKGLRCRGCFFPKRQAKFCGDCGLKVCARQNESGYCRRCLLARANPDRRISALREASKRPEVRQKRRLAMLQRVATPEIREKLREAGRQNFHLTLGSEKGRARSYAPDTIARRARTRSETVMAWCPPEYREQYHDLNRNQRVPASEARAMIESQMATAEARRMRADQDLSPFERQMQAIARGAHLIERPVLRSRDPDYTLGGVTDWAA